MALDSESPTPTDEPGYHIRPIEKREVGTLGKIAEEVEEALDAQEQGVELMVLIELADIVGAIKHYLAANHPELSLSDLEKMADVTARAFRAGRRI